MDYALIAACVLYVLGGTGWWAFMAEAEGEESLRVLLWALVWPLVAVVGIAFTAFNSVRRAMKSRAR